MLRTTLEGRVLGPQHRLSLEAALCALTIDAAFAVGIGERIGSLEPGRAADLAWLASHVWTVPAEEFERVEVVGTWIDGEAPGDRRQD